MKFLKKMFTFKLYLSWKKTVLRNIKAPLGGCFSVAEKEGYCDKSQDFARQGKSVIGDRPKGSNQISFPRNKKDHLLMVSFCWRRKRDLLLSSLPQNSPLDYFFANGEHATFGCSLLIQTPLNLQTKNPKPKTV